MALVDLLNTPKNEAEWEIYSFSNREQVSEIRQAIKVQKNTILRDYVLYPINFDNIKFWLQNNQQAHLDFNAVLGLQGSDLQDVDIKEPNQLQSWVWINYQELFSASAALHI